VLRNDRKGVAWFLADGRRVVALDETGADIVTQQGSRQRFYRSPIKAWSFVKQIWPAM
jgi:hypothetical protein